MTLTKNVDDRQFSNNDASKTETSNRDFLCPKCGQVIGTFYEVDGLDLVKMGACLHRSIEATCIHCGRMVYYHFSDKQLMRLVRKVVKRV